MEYCDPLQKDQHKADTVLYEVPIISLMTGAGHLSSQAESQCTLLLPAQSGKLLKALCEATAAGKNCRVSNAIRQPVMLTEKGSSPHILLAEDNLVNQRVAQTMLARLDYQADWAANGRQAVENWSTGAYGLILMDCHMPKMVGFEATAKIREAESNLNEHRTPIVAITASAMPEDRDRCFELGMDDFVSKPVSLAALQPAIKKCILDPVA